MEIYYKLGQHTIQIREAFLLQIGAKLCQIFYYKLGQVLQIRVKFITNWGKLLQIMAQHSPVTSANKATDYEATITHKIYRQIETNSSFHVK